MKKIGKRNKSITSQYGLHQAQQRRMLARAVSNGEFKLFLQFVYDVSAERFCGAEALSRWEHPTKGLLPPAQYIEDMKALGLVDRLDFNILDGACRLLEKWSRRRDSDLWLSCNFTRATVSSASFFLRFLEVLERYTFPRHNLVIELSEDSLADDAALIYDNILACKNIGCRIALDDLGSGYTSIRDLCDYPVDIVKIDRDIIAKAKTDRGNALLKGVSRLAHEMDICVLCEGVETPEQDRLVRDINCDYIQGFYYSHVLPLNEALEFYLKGQPEDLLTPDRGIV